MATVEHSTESSGSVQKQTCHLLTRLVSLNSLDNCRYDEALNGALRSEQDNIQLRSDLVHLEAVRLKSVEGGRNLHSVPSSL